MMYAIFSFIQENIELSFYFLNSWRQHPLESKSHLEGSTLTEVTSQPENLHLRGAACRVLCGVDIARFQLVRMVLDGN